MTYRALPGKRKIHRAKLIGDNGEVSPLCAKSPRAIDVKPTSKETWTVDDYATTCRGCIRVMKTEGRR